METDHFCAYYRPINVKSGKSIFFPISIKNPPPYCSPQSIRTNSNKNLYLTRFHLSSTHTHTHTLSHTHTYRKREKEREEEEEEKIINALFSQLLRLDSDLRSMRLNFPSLSLLHFGDFLGWSLVASIHESLLSGPILPPSSALPHPLDESSC